MSNANNAGVETRLLNILSWRRETTLDELAKLSDHELMEIENMGRQTIAFLRAKTGTVDPNPIKRCPECGHLLAWRPK